MLTIGSLSEKTGIKSTTIRYYEQRGMIPLPTRSEGNHRIYTRDHVARLHFIKRGRELGFSLAEVSQLLGLNDGSPPSCAQVHKVTDAHLENIRSKIADLRKIELILSDLSGRCARNASLECPVIDAIYGDSQV